MSRHSTLRVTLTAMASFAALPVFADALQGLTWSEQKCVLYEGAVAAALEMQGGDGLGQEFLSANREFIDSGCQTRGQVCPRSEAELELANLLTIMTMNEGMASTFVPFSCS